MHGIPARDAARPQGYEVLLADKASFPSDIISTHYIHQPGVARLGRWALLDELTCELATLEPPSLEMQHRFAAMRGDQVAISRFLGTLAGSVEIADFFSSQI
jgi:hypothetical protein